MTRAVMRKVNCPKKEANLPKPLASLDKSSLGLWIRRQAPPHCVFRLPFLKDGSFHNCHGTNRLLRTSGGFGPTNTRDRQSLRFVIGNC